MSQYVVEIEDDDFAAEQQGLYGCGTCGFGDLGDWTTASKKFWDEAKSKGIAGTDLRAILQYFVSIASNAPDLVRYPFMYEIESRTELQSSAKVPGWLLDQIQTRLQGIVTGAGVPGEAEQILQYAKSALSKGTIGGKTSTTVDVTSGKKAPKSEKKAAPAAVSKDAVKAAVKAAEGKGGVPWLLIGAGVAVLAGGVLVWSAFRKPTPAVAGLARRGRRRR